MTISDAILQGLSSSFTGTGSLTSRSSPFGETVRHIGPTVPTDLFCQHQDYKSKSLCLTFSA